MIFICCVASVDDKAWDKALLDAHRRSLWGWVNAVGSHFVQNNESIYLAAQQVFGLLSLNNFSWVLGDREFTVMNQFLNQFCFLNWKCVNWNFNLITSDECSQRYEISELSQNMSEISSDEISEPLSLFQTQDPKISEVWSVLPYFSCQLILEIFPWLITLWLKCRSWNSRTRSDFPNSCVETTPNSWFDLPMKEFETFTLCRWRGKNTQLIGQKQKTFIQPPVSHTRHF